MYITPYSTKRQNQGRLIRMVPQNDHSWRKILPLLVFIALLAIVAAIAIPSHYEYPCNKELRVAAKQIQADFLELQARAITDKIIYRITFGLRENSYTIEIGTETGGPYTTLEVKSLSSSGRDVGVFFADFGGGIPTITFGARGIATNGKVVLTNSRGSTATIAAAVSGRTYVQVDNR